MKIAILFFVILFLSFPAIALELSEIPIGEDASIQEWGIRFADLIAKATISYDKEKYITIESKGDKKDLGPTYYLQGTIKFEEIIYANAHSRDVEILNYYLKNLDKKHKVLIPARRIYFDHMLPNELRLEAKDKDLIAKGIVLCGLKQIYLYPINHLVLEGISPPEKDDVLISIAEKRKYNLKKIIK